jgi:hypothetical protein
VICPDQISSLPNPTRASVHTLPIPSRPLPKHAPSRARIRARQRSRDANPVAAARAGGALLVRGAALGAAGAALVYATRPAARHADARALGGHGADAAVVGVVAARFPGAAAGAGAAGDVWDGGCDAFAGAARVARDAGVVAGAAVLRVGLQVAAGVGGGAAEGGCKAGAGA